MEKLLNREPSKYELGYKCLEEIASNCNMKYYEIVEDTYIYDNGLCLIEYADEKYEDEISVLCIDLDNMNK